MKGRVPVLASLASLAALGCSPTTERQRVDFERMRVQQRYEPYQGSRLLPGGLSMQAPPAGTVSREAAAAPLASDPAAITALKTIPVPVTPALLARGRDRFRIYCAVCHGPAGFGGSVVAENMGVPRPVSLHGDIVRALSVGQLFEVATQGFGRMPPYAPQLTPSDRWAVVAYVRQLETQPATSAEAIDDSLRAARIHAVDDSVSAAQARRADSVSAAAAKTEGRR